MKILIAALWGILFGWFVCVGVLQLKLVRSGVYDAQLVQIQKLTADLVNIRSEYQLQEQNLNILREALHAYEMKPNPPLPLVFGKAGRSGPFNVINIPKDVCNSARFEKRPEAFAIQCSADNKVWFDIGLVK